MSVARLPVYEWCARAARGELPGLDWVDLTPDPELAAFTIGADGRFRPRSYAAMLPPPMVRAAADAHDAGQPTLLAGLTALFARPEWILHGRSLLWSPLGPAPAQLGFLFEALGLPAALHEDDPDRMARLAVRLRQWRERAGEVELALTLLREVADADTTGIEREPALAHEVLACHRIDWWRARRPAAFVPRIEGGWVRFQTPDAPMPLLREDLGVRPTASLSVLVRLLPAWACLRVFAPPEVS